MFAHNFQTIRPLAERDNPQIDYAVLEVPDLVVGDPAHLLRLPADLSEPQHHMWCCGSDNSVWATG